jgi:hypothetical protein
MKDNIPSLIEPRRLGKPIGLSLSPWRDWLEDGEIAREAYTGPLGIAVDKPKGF